MWNLGITANYWVSSRGCKQPIQSCTNENTGCVLVMSVGTPTDVPAFSKLWHLGGCVVEFVSCELVALASNLVRWPPTH